MRLRTIAATAAACVGSVLAPALAPAALVDGVSAAVDIGVPVDGDVATTVTVAVAAPCCADGGALTGFALGAGLDLVAVLADDADFTQLHVIIGPIPNLKPIDGCLRRSVVGEERNHHIVVLVDWLTGCIHTWRLHGWRLQFCCLLVCFRHQILPFCMNIIVDR